MVHSPEQQNEGLEERTGIYPIEDPARNGQSDCDALEKIHKEILRYLEQGYTKRQAADAMVMSVHTLDGHLRDIYRIINVHTMTAAVAKAIREKMI